MNTLRGITILLEIREKKKNREVIKLNFKNKDNKNNNHSLNKVLYLKKLQSRDLSDSLNHSKIDKTLFKHTKWSLRQKCVITGNCLESVNSKIIVHLPMDLMNFKRNSTYPWIIRQKFVYNSINKGGVIMAIDASFCIHSMI